MTLPARFLSRFFLIFIVAFSASLFIPGKLFAQSQQFSADYTTSINPDVPRNDHTRTQIVFFELTSTLICAMTGVDILDPEKGCLGIDPQTRKIGYVEQEQPSQLGGLLGFGSQAVSTLYTQPLSSTQYVTYLADNFGLVKKTHAQQEGVGFQRFSPIRELWVQFRNIAYILIVLIFVIIGAAIMLRVKIDPRTVMSIQNQLPKAIITIILITFSYAISGFLVDGMWITTYLGIDILVPDEKLHCPDPSGSQQDLTDIEANQPAVVQRAAYTNLLNNPFSYVRELFGDETGCFGSFGGIGGMAHNAASPMSEIVSQTILTALGGDPEPDCGLSFGGIKGCLQWGVWYFIKFIAEVILFLILVFAILAALIRLWIMLIRAYIYTIIGTITAPLWIGAGLLPGQQSFGFTKWFRFMLAHLSAFPATAALLVLARVIAATPTFTPDQPGFLPPLVANGYITNQLQSLIAIGILFVAPEILTMTREAFRSQPNKIISPAIIGGFGRGVGPGTAPARATWKQLTHYDKTTQEAGTLRAWWMAKGPGRITRRLTRQVSPIGRQIARREQADANREQANVAPGKKSSG